MKSIKLRFFILIVLFTAFSLSAQDTGLSIKRINFTGLKKTQDFYMQHQVAKFINKQANPETISQLETVLQTEGLFEKIDINVLQTDYDSAVIEVTVKEKLSFIPVPIISYSDSSFTCGGAVIDTNALGIKSTYLVGGMYSNDSGLFITAFSKPAMDWAHPGFGINLFYAKGTNDTTDAYNNDLFSYKSQAFNAGISLLTKFNDYASASVGISYNWINVSNYIKNDIGIESQNVFTLKPTFSMARPEWNGCFLSTNSITVAVATKYITDGPHTYAQSMNSKIQIQKPLCTRLRFTSEAGMTLMHNMPYISWADRNDGCVSILGSHFYTQSIQGVSTGLEGAVLINKIGTFTLYGNYQICTCDDTDKSVLLSYGFEGGIKMYLAKLAMPAFSLGLSYNQVTQQTQYAVSFGASF